MNRLKVIVYGISKNEEKHVKRFMNSIKDADDVYILDTGSTDNTVSLLKECGANVSTCLINPWRFDVARNKSLEMVPEDVDVCICLDLDEVLLDGWRDVIEKLWFSDITRLRYNYNWSLDDNDNPKVNFYIEKIHCRNGYSWINPVHEILKCDGVEKIITTDEITVNHYPDSSKSRASYLPLLELSVVENPENDRNMHYLGREYMYYQRWNDAIDTLIKHLNLKNATWKDERCASMRFIARCYKQMHRYDEANMWLEKAIKEAPYLREPYVEFALLEYELENWDKVIYYCDLALFIKSNPKTYINESFSYDHTVFDLLSIAYYNQCNYPKALYYILKAIELSPENQRLRKNKELIERELNN